MSDLSELRNHARRMAATPPLDLMPTRGGNCERGAHHRCLIGFATCPCSCHDGERARMPSAADRALWTQIADEIDAHLDDHHDDDQLELT